VSGERVRAARDEIARRRALAEAATPGPWEAGERCVFYGGNDHPALLNGRTGSLVSDGYDGDGGVDTPESAAFIAANDPAHVLGVLDAAEKVLERHARTLSRPLCAWDGKSWPCPDALAVLDLYAPEATS
jgi:hypothetical protein